MISRGLGGSVLVMGEISVWTNCFAWWELVLDGEDCNCWVEFGSLGRFVYYICICNNIIYTGCHFTGGTTG